MTFPLQAPAKCFKENLIKGLRDAMLIIE